MSCDSRHPRSIRSFVRRAGRMTAGQKLALEQLWPRYGIDYREALAELPRGYAACKLEIGIGNGDALLAMAAAEPECLYLGIDVHAPGIGRCLNGIEAAGLGNVRLFRHDAVEVLRHMLAPASLDRVLLLFPDPWPKKRHHKRRIVNAAFRDLVHAVLRPGAAIHVATDWQDYAEDIAAQFLADARFGNRGDAAGFSPRPAGRPATRFEQRGRRLGHDVRDLVFVKR